MFFISKQKLLLIVQGVVFLAMIGITAYILESRFQLLSEYIEALRSRDLTYVDDRIGILQVAWENFKQYPLFGSGGLYSSRFYLEERGPITYHNTIAQVSTLGVTGILAFFYLFAVKSKIILDSKGSFKWFALIMIFVTAFVNGALQPMYFYTTYMVFLFLVLACIEVTLDIKEKPTSYHKKEV